MQPNDPTFLYTWYPLETTNVENLSAMPPVDFALRHLARYLVHCLPGYVLNRLFDYLLAGIQHEIPPVLHATVRQRMINTISNLADLDNP